MRFASKTYYTRVPEATTAACLVSTGVGIAQRYSKTIYDIDVMEMILNELQRTPILSPEHPDCVSTRFGFEGGTVVRQGGFTWIFTTENYDAPKNCRVRLSCWRSSDGTSFRRAATLRDVAGTVGDRSSFNCSWAPNLVFSEEEDRWHCYYIYYMHKEEGADPWNMFGRPGVLKSIVRGRYGLEGPYESHGIAPLGDEPQPWEGTCGQVSFYPYKTAEGWFSFYGSNSIGTALDASSNPQEGEGEFRFMVGLMTSRSINGPWHRLPKGNPVQLNPRFIENPIVKRLASGPYIVIFDGGCRDQISYSESDDGIVWQQAKRLLLPPDRPAQLSEVRTPLGLAENIDGTFDLYFTAFDGHNPDQAPPLWHDGFGCLWKANVSIREDR